MVERNVLLDLNFMKNLYPAMHQLVQSSFLITRRIKYGFSQVCAIMLMLVGFQSFAAFGITTENSQIQSDIPLGIPVKVVTGGSKENTSNLRTLAPSASFPMQKGMALVSRLSDPRGRSNAGSNRMGKVLGLYDVRQPHQNTAPNAITNWDAVTNNIFRHADWTNRRMGEIFGIEVDNFVNSSPKVYIGSTGFFVGYFDVVLRSGQNTGAFIHAEASPAGGDLYSLDATTGAVSTITTAIPSTRFNYNGGHGAPLVTIPLDYNTGVVKTVKVINGGSGYTNGQALTITGGNPTIAAGAVAIVSGGAITGVAFWSNGAGYKNPATNPVTISAPLGSGFVGVVEVGFTPANSTYPVTPGGSGYTPSALATAYVHGDGSGMIASANVNGNGQVTSYSTLGGSGYTFPPTVTIDNRYTGVGNIGHNKDKNILYTCSLDNGLIYAVDASSGALIGSPFNHQPAYADIANKAVTHFLRIAVGMSWNKRDNRLYFARPSATGYTTEAVFNTFTHTTNEVMSIGLNADGSINTSETPKKEISFPAATLNYEQSSIITDIEFTKTGKIALLGEMGIGPATYRTTNTEYRFIKGVHNGYARELRYTGTTAAAAGRVAADDWTVSATYHVGQYANGYNNSGGVDFGYDNSSDPRVFYDSAIMTGDILDGTGSIYGIQISPLTQDNFPTNTKYPHYLVDDDVNTGAWEQKLGIFDVDVFTGFDIMISGHVFHDANGLNPTPVNTVDGVLIQSPSSTPLHANLFNNLGVFIGTVPIDANGYYEFTGITPNSTYTVTIGTTAGTSTSTIASTTTLPTGWVNTGEHIGTGEGSDGVPSGTQQVTTVEEDIPEINFGIEHQPNSDNKTGTLPSTPVSNSLIRLNGTVPQAQPLTGSDPEDQATSGTLSGKDVGITSLPTNGELWYNGTKITVGKDGVNPPSPTNPFVIENLNPDLLQIKFTGTGYTETQFTYAYIDDAGVIDPTPATYVLNWEDPMPVRLIQFVARHVERDVLLNWATSEEKDSWYFEVQHSYNGEDWTDLARVKMKSEGNTVNVLNQYDYRHLNPWAGNNYYRLKMVDLDGTFAFSTIKKVTVSLVEGLFVYPNPAVDVINLGSLNLADYKSIRLLDSSGSTVYKSAALVDKINVQNFVPGIYMLTVENKAGKTTTLKVFIGK